MDGIETSVYFFRKSAFRRVSSTSYNIQLFSTDHDNCNKWSVGPALKTVTSQRTVGDGCRGDSWDVLRCLVFLSWKLFLRIKKGGEMHSVRWDKFEPILVFMICVTSHLFTSLQCGWQPHDLSSKPSLLAIF